MNFLNTKLLRNSISKYISIKIISKVQGFRSDMTEDIATNSWNYADSSRRFYTILRSVRSINVHDHDTVSTNRSKNVNDLQTHRRGWAWWKNSARYREVTIHGQPPLWKYCFNSGHGFTRSLLSGRPPRFVVPLPPRRYTSA